MRGKFKVCHFKFYFNAVARSARLLILKITLNIKLKLVNKLNKLVT